MNRVRNVLVLILGALLSTSHGATAGPEEWGVFVTNHCMDCHDSVSSKGGVDLEAALEAPLADSAATWERALRQMEGRLMPPVGKDRPSEAEYAALTESLVRALDMHAGKHPNPGRTDSLRRLNRTEYENAVRDLLAVEIDGGEMLPPDQSSHGFDNVTLSELSPALLDRYISAAQKISRLALGRVGKSPEGRTVRIRPDITQEHHVEGLPLGTRGGTLVQHAFPRDGEYDVRIHLMRDRDEKVEGLRGVHELQVLVDGAVASAFEVRPPENRSDHTKVDAHLSARIKVKAGKRMVGVTFVSPPPDLIETLRQPYQSAYNQHRHPRRSPAIFQFSITGPYHPVEAGEVGGEGTVLGQLVARNEAGARRLLAALLRRAYRGHDNESDLERTMEFFREGSGGGDFDAGLEAALSAILVSPKFLFRVERDPPGGRSGLPYSVDDLALATRLSFFLWSSLPDDALLDAAEEGKLREPAERAKQVRRMLVDPRARSLATNFASQWLYLRNLDSITPDGRLYPDFDDNLRQAMRRETELLFEFVMREDRSALELLTTRHTFLNERLAKHYGIPHVYGERFRRVALGEQSKRGGILRHASVLTVTSYANRTSPVLRGHWVLENLLGTPPPPPPPDIPALDDNTVDASLSVRERLAVHRENKTCARCHDAMDPLGFAFENFDAVGRWRTREGEAPVDASGTLPDGTKFRGIEEFERGLLQRPELFVRTLTEKLLTFALGRGIDPADAPAMREIVRKAAQEDYRFSEIIVQIVGSDPFTMRMPRN